MKKLICGVMVWVLMLSFSHHVIAIEPENSLTETQVYSNATLADDFADNHVMVVLNNATSLEFNEYDASDFAEISCAGVQNLTRPMETKMKTMVANNNVALFNRIGYVSTETEAINNYKQVICLELENAGKENVLAAIQRLQERDDVLYAGPDYIGTYSSVTTTTPSDPYYNNQWALEKIQAPRAWEITTGSASVLVGIVDSGIDSTHPDLQGRLAANLCRDFSSGEGVQDPTPTDQNGHGTMMAGIIGANRNNSTGMVGVCDNVKLVSLKVSNTSAGNVNSSRVASAIAYAQSANIPILNVSIAWNMGMPLSRDRYDYALDTVITQYSGLIVCASGNDHIDLEDEYTTVYPASYTHSHLLVVGASNSTDSIWISGSQGSNYGQLSVDLFAPGSAVLTCQPIGQCSGCNANTTGHVANGYHYVNGTSIATPHVTGVAALMLSYNPYLTPAQIKQIIMDNVDIVYDANGNNVFGELCVSGGRLNAYKAVRAAYHTHDEYFDVCDEWHGHSCEVCDSMGFEEPHEYVRYARNPGANSGTTHRKYCHCGYYVVEDHVVRAANDGSATFPAQCLICGLIATDGGSAIVSIPITPEIMTMGTYTLSDGTTVQILTENGSYVLPNGIIVLVDEDADLAEAGLLDPYALVENLPTPSNPGQVTE